MSAELAILDWHWEITKRCNLKCLHCIMGDCSDYEMTTDEAFAAISSIVKLGGKRLFIAGGEPLMRKDICSIIERAFSAGLVVSLITNGTKIDKTFLKNVGRCIQNIAISIDGHSQVQDEIRGHGMYDKCVSALRLISEFNIDTAVYTTINSLNETVINELLEGMIAEGVRNFHFNEINPEGRAQKNKYLLLSPKTSEDRAELILLQLKKIIEIESFELGTTCSILPSTVYLRADGNIYACVELAFKRPSSSIANILRQDIGVIKKRVEKFFLSFNRPQNNFCCYTSFAAPGININLNEDRKCPIIRRIDNEFEYT